MTEEFIYNVANTKSYGHVLVNIHDWESDKIITQINLKGKILPSQITRVVKINSAPAYRPLPFSEGDLIAISNVAARIGFIKPMILPNDSNTYANIHLSQVLGYFKNGELSIDNFEPIYDKVVMEKTDVPSDTVIQFPTDTMSVGTVLKVGRGGFTDSWKKRPMRVEVAKEVLIRDNVATSLSIGNKTYYVIDDKNIVGEFRNKDYKIENLKLYDKEFTIFKPYEEKNIHGTVLLKPVLDDETDIAQSYQDNMFEVINSSKFSKDLVYYVSRFDTEYIKYQNKTYFITGNDKVMAHKKPRRK